MSEDVGFHMEFTLDEERRKMVIYVQDSDSHRPHALAVDTLVANLKAGEQSADLEFEADPLPKEPAGHASRFSMSLDRIPQQLLTSNQFSLKLSFSVDGKSIDGSMSHHNDHTHEYHHD